MARTKVKGYKRSDGTKVKGHNRSFTSYQKADKSKLRGKLRKARRSGEDKTTLDRLKGQIKRVSRIMSGYKKMGANNRKFSAVMKKRKQRKGR